MDNSENPPQEPVKVENTIKVRKISLRNITNRFRAKSGTLVKIFVFALILLTGISGGYVLANKKILPISKKQTVAVPKDKYLAFLSEIYDTVKENYWDKLTDEQLVNLYVLGTEKLTNQPQPEKPKDKTNLQKMLSKILKEMTTDEKKKDFSSKLADIVLANLQPFGRSRLYSKKEEISLKNNVENKNPEVNQYQVLDVKKDAPLEEVKQTFETKTEELKQEIAKETAPEKKAEKQQELTLVQKAYQVLGDQESRKVYDESGVEPTMEYKLLRPDIFYLHLTKFSPTTIDELLRVTKKFEGREGLNILIFDLRDNVGGAIDGLPYFIGPFIGNDQYAYQFFHQGDKEDFKTKIGWLPSLVQYKKVIVLINQNTQSSAEVMAATLKKYNVGILVGTPTKGWGTVEKVFDIKQQIDPNEKFSAFLVHSLTLRDDGQPIEGKGVEPTISITDPNWEKEFYTYFRYPELTNVVKGIFFN